MGSSGALACPHIGTEIQQNLLNLQERLSHAGITPDFVKATEQQVEEELRKWGEGAAGYFKNKASEVREVMIVLAHMAEAVGERDQKYNSQFNDFHSRLQDIADLEDLTNIRKSLLLSAQELKTCVDKMALDSQESMTQLRSELTSYQTRLEVSERLASIDTLTGLNNRRQLELELEARIKNGRDLCIMILDLNGFKQINDKLGHLAGDQILKQFATELRSVTRATDTLGRWGGDEFLMILDCNLQAAKSQVERIREWVFGRYSVETGTCANKVDVSASIGVAEWQAGDSSLGLLQRADGAMYKEKSHNKKGK